MQTPTDPATSGRLLQPVLTDLAGVVAGIRSDQFAGPTPCSEFDVAALRRHVLAWVDYFSHAYADPDGTGDRPDPQLFEAPDDPEAAADVVRAASARITQALDDGVADRDVLVVSSTMPGAASLRMTLWEYLTHGDDLARATGQRWDPPLAAVEDALDFAPRMLTDEYRGPGKDFGHPVPVADDAPPLDRLLAFGGRDPAWRP